MDESHGVGAGAGGLGGAAAGLTAGGIPDAAAAGFEGTDGAVLSEGVLTSACTEPDVVAFTPPGAAGCSAVGFGSPSGGGDEGDLISSGIAANAQTYGFEN